MSKRQVIILWSIAAALAITITVVKLSRKAPGEAATERSPGQTLFESFPAAEVAGITIEGVGDTITLKQSGEQWLLAERDDYPVDATAVLELLRTLDELEITRGIEADPSFAPRFGMDPRADEAQQHGLILTFRDADGGELAKVSLGKAIENAANNGLMGGPMVVGRYIRNHADPSGFYATSEMFPAVSAEARNWLRDTFINPEKIRSVAVIGSPQQADGWKLSRETEEAAFQLVDAAADELANASNARQLGSLLAYARFLDVVPAAELSQRSAETGKITAVIETFEGFTYTLTLVPSADDQERMLMAVEVDAALPATRRKEDGETAEEAAMKDEAFSKRLQSLTDKLTEAEFFEGRTYLIERSTVAPLLHKRAEMVTKVAASPAAGLPTTQPGADNRQPAAEPSPADTQ